MQGASNKPYEETPLTEIKARELADLTATMPFHTLGKGPTQAAAGNHRHTGLYIEIENIVAGPGISVAYDLETGKLTISAVP